MINKKKLLNERAERMVTYNPFDLFFSKKIRNGSFVTVGYLKDANEESGLAKVSGVKNNIPDNHEKFHEFLDIYADTLWAQDYAQNLESAGYKAALSGAKKTAKISIDGHIVRVQKFQYNWRDPEKFANKWADESDEVMQARANAGFGQGVNDWDENEEFTDNTDDSYAEDDWRRKPKYMGTGVRQRGLKKAASSGYRFPTAAPGLYSYSGTDETKYDSMAVRNMLDPRVNTKSGYKSLYYYVAPDGTMELMPQEFIDFIRNAYKGVRNVKPTEPDVMTDPEEIEFNEVIKAINKKYADKQEPTDLLFDKILYICASPVNWNDNTVKGDSKQRMAFINNRAIYKEFPYLKAKELNKVIVQYCTDIFPIDKEEARYMSPEEKITRRSQGIERVTEKKKMSKNTLALYESIMLEVSKTIKKHLNETYYADNSFIN